MVKNSGEKIKKKVVSVKETKTTKTDRVLNEESKEKPVSGVKSKESRESKKNKKKNKILEEEIIKEEVLEEESKEKPIVSTQKMNELVKEILSKSLGEDYILLIEELKDFVYDEDVAKKIGIKTTIIRKWLNELHTNSLVEYARTKNKKTGWYVYLWRIRENKILEYAINILNKEIEKVRNEIEEESNFDFRCSCTKYNFSEAMELNFECPKCKTKIEKSNFLEEPEDKKKIISDIEEKIKKLKKLKNLFQ